MTAHKVDGKDGLTEAVKRVSFFRTRGSSVKMEGEGRKEGRRGGAVHELRFRAHVSPFPSAASPPTPTP